jgi:hypothetical protein
MAAAMIPPAMTTLLTNKCEPVTFDCYQSIRHFFPLFDSKLSDIRWESTTNFKALLILKSAFFAAISMLQNFCLT